MNDMSESKQRILAEGLKILEERKARNKANRFVENDGKKAVHRSATTLEEKHNTYAEKRAAAVPQPKRRIKTTAVAAFMFLPQIGLSLKGFAHIYPVFIRMLCGLLVQAGMLPPEHPSLKYGVAGVPKVGFRKMMGEAWFNLRTRKSTAAQYGIFSAVVMASVSFVALVTTFFGHLFVGFGAQAQAQLFANPSNPYGAGGKTDLTQVQGITGATGLFDSRVEGNGISVDYALMVLDKILRQAAVDTPNGGALQNALAAMMQTYNAGVTIVAGVMIFWMVVSIILDTAKTGVFGGGRHNMVWAPIRVIFALGLMFPLGSGFSSGQYMVMKLAEWGSNFGSNGWSAYVTGVVGDQSLFAPFTSNASSSLASSLSKVMVCQVAYNTYVQQATGAQDPDQAIGRHQDDPTNAANIVNHYTNNTAGNVCGTITYASAATGADMAAVIDQTSGSSPMTASTGIVSASDYTYKNASLATALKSFRLTMRGALENELKDTPTGTLGSGGATLEMARQFACKFVARKFPDGGAANPVGTIPQCNAGLAAAAATDPDASQQQAIVNSIKNALMNAYNSPGAKGALTTYVGGPMITEMTKRGWAGMGMWYQDISALNAVIASAREPAASVDPGSVWSGPGSSSWWRCVGSKLIGNACRIDGLEEKVVSVLSDYDRWWEASTLPGAPGRTTMASDQSNTELESGGGSFSGFLSWVRNASVGDNGILTVLARLILPRSTDVFIFKAVDLAATNTYPLAQLADTGHNVLGIGLFIWASITLLQTLSTIKVASFSLGVGLAVSALVNLIATIGSGMVLSGIMIAFYLPMVPFLRVAFAVLTWAVSVFEAVVMVPVAALMHLTSTSSGLAGDYGRNAWILWLNVLMRPVLVVVGFVAGMLIYNSFAVFFHTTFSQGAAAVMSTTNFFMVYLAKVCYSVIYLGVLFTAANTSFKLLDVLPDALMKWMGSNVKADFKANAESDGRLFASQQIVSSFFKPTQLNTQTAAQRDAELTARAENVKGLGDKQLTAGEQKQAENDINKTMSNMSSKEKTEYANLPPKDQKAYIAQKFLEQENSGNLLRGYGTRRFGGSSLLGPDTAMGGPTGAGPG